MVEELLFLDQILQSNNYILSRRFFDTLTEPFKTMKKDVTGSNDNKTFYRLHIDEALWTSRVTVLD